MTAAVVATTAPPTHPIPVPGASIDWYVARALDSYRRHVTEVGLPPAEAYAIVVGARVDYDDDVLVAVVRAVTAAHTRVMAGRSCG